MYVPDDYEKSFKQADETFLYQLVFDPVSMKLVPLNELPEDLQPGDLEFAGPYPFIIRNQIKMAVFLLNPCVGGAVVSWLMRSSWDHAVRV